MSNIQLTTTGAISDTMQTYYDRKLLYDMQPHLVHYQYGQKRRLPRNNGKTVNFRKWTSFAALTTALTEGTTPSGQNLGMTDVSATVAQYGGFVEVSDLLDLTALDPVINDAVELMANQGALTIDTLTREVLHAGTNVIRVNGRGTRGAVATGDTLTVDELRSAVRLLKKNKAPQFMRGGKGYYVAVVGPDAVFDLQDDATWQSVNTYAGAEQIFNGEIGRIFGCIVVETPEAKIFEDAGASSIDVVSTLVFGKDAFGVIELDGSNVRTIIKPAGSAGASDPLDQRATVGWKVNGFAAAILQDDWLVRIESALSV